MAHPNWRVKSAAWLAAAGTIIRVRLLEAGTEVRLGPTSTAVARKAGVEHLAPLRRRGPRIPQLLVSGNVVRRAAQSAALPHAARRADPVSPRPGHGVRAAGSLSAPQR